VYFRVYDADRGGDRVFRVVEAIATCRHSDAGCFSFLWAVIIDEVGVGYFSVSRDGTFSDGCNCACSYDLF